MERRLFAWNRKPFPKTIILLLSFAVTGAMAAAQMGNPANGPTKIPNSQLDPTRGILAPTLESSIHTPLPEQYIWTKEDAVPQDVLDSNNWRVGGRKDLEPHYFRKTFEASAVPEHATLYIAGPRSAEIYLNGHKVGSYRLNLDFPMGIRVYACDVTAALHSGSNVLAIEAVRGPNVGSGSDTRLSMQQTQGEVMVVKIVPAAHGLDAAPLLITDRSWKASLHAANGWQDAGFNDAGWENADSLGGVESSIEFFQWNADAGLYDWPGYDGISPFLSQYALPAIKVSHVNSNTGTLSHVDALTQKDAGAEFEVELPQAREDAYHAPQILLDFGREVVGRLKLVSDSDEAGRVTIQYGESEGEAFHEPYLGIDPIYVAPHGTAYGPKSAFRYALIRFTGGKDVRYKAIELAGIQYPVTYQGYFDSSDPSLNQMWTVGAYTAHLCMQDDIWDAPKRDRGRWMGDLDVSGRTIEDAFGDRFLMSDTLDRLLGTTPIREDVNGIPGYSAFWVIGEAHYYTHMGSMKQLESTHTRLVQLLNYMKKELDSRQLFADTNHAWPFVDWSPELNGKDAETLRATQMEFYAAFRDGVYLLRQLHDTANADRFAKEADAMKAASQKYLLDPSGSFGTRWQVNAYAVLSGVANPSQYPAIWKNSLASVGHIKYNALIMTPYYTYYVVSAMAKMDQRQAALDWIRKYWGGMLDEGATSFWEGYDPAWYKGSDFHASLQADNMSGYRVSLAHGWSSGVTPWLMEQVLGIHSTGQGFSTVSIRPDLLDLKWVRGAEPTPRGLLGVAIKKDGTSGTLTSIDLPADTVARVSVPVTSATAQVLVNGKAVKGASAEGGHRRVVVLKTAGHYAIESL
ncbi:MAG TPA: alpha-L-rhamnosidase C-terminal domain-containing protein [Acidobacteriaceae bacterium]|nr:alpha-L-rhamnosidase C-terminal domain-containing protein [Acidobacteriaceae bacterium]